MASSLMKRAADTLERQKTTIKRLHATQEADLVYGGLGELVGAGGGAIVDIKMGKNGDQAKLGPVPTNLLIGLAPVAAAIFIKGLGKARAPIAGLGFGVMGVGLYRFILDKHAAAASQPAG